MKQNSKINMIPIETLLNIVTYDFLKLMRNRNKEGGSSDKQRGLWIIRKIRGTAKICLEGNTHRLRCR